MTQGFRLVESLEPRTHLTFAEADTTFGTGGRANIPVAANTITNPVTELASGRVLIWSGDTVRYLRSNGTADTTRGKNGALKLSRSIERVIDVTVNKASGRIAVLRAVGSVEGPTQQFTVELYSPKGGSNVRRVLTESQAITPRFVRFDNNDGVYAFGTFITRQATSEVDSSPPTMKLYHFNSSLDPDAGFGTGGVLTHEYAPTLERHDSITARQMHIDATGRVYFIYSYHDNDDLNDGERNDTVAIRFSTAGTFDAGYAEDGTATLVSDQHFAPSDVFDESNLVESTIDSSGQLYFLATFSNSSNSTRATERRELVRLNADGTGRTSVVVGGDKGSNTSGATLALDGAGKVYVAVGANQRVEIYRLSATTLAVDPTWSNLDSYITTTVKATVAAGVTVNANGRILVSSSGLYAIKGPTEVISPTTPSGQVRLLADGTLLILGTSKTDTIVVRSKKGSYLVELNGRKFTIQGIVDGTVIAAGKGDDRITMAHWGNAYIQGGAGNDVIIATSAGNMLFGGSGDDSLVCGGGADELYGQEGNDTLVGGSGSDELSGGEGNDKLYASRLVDTSITTSDSFPDNLFGGAGADFLRVDDEGLSNSDFANAILEEGDVLAKH